MKEGWQIKTLNEVCVVERGSSPRPIKSYFTTNPDGVNWIKIGDTEQDGRYVYSTAQKITPEGAKQSRFVKEGDFILTNSMSFGRPYIMKTSGYIHDGWFVFRLKDSLDTDYFYHLLSSPLVQNQFASLASGAIVKNISGDLVKKTKLPIPPLPEQQRIVAILDDAFESIAIAKANAEKNLQNAKALFESYLDGVFSKGGEGWVEKRLKDVCEKITDGTHQTPTYFDEGVVFLSSRNVTSGKINWDKIKYIDEKQHLEMHRRVAPRRGDILLAKNGTTGVAAMVDRDTVFDIYVSLALLRATEVINPNFLLYFVNSPVAKQQFNKRLKGAGVPNLHLEEIREVNISFPLSLDEQSMLVERLDAISFETQRLESLYQQKITALDELKKALLHQAFSGQL